MQFLLFLWNEMFFGIKSVEMFEKNGNLWVRDQENIVGVAKSRILSQ